MSYSITYKPLFELRIIHAYFLENEDYFVESDPKHLEAVDYQLENQIAIIPLPKTRQLLDDQRIIIKPTKFGCIAFCEVKETGPESFIPFVDLEAETTLSFGLKVKNPYFNNFTNTRLSPNINGIFYFDNYRNKAAQQYPSIAQSPSEIVTRSYEMGETVAGVKIATTTTSMPIDPEDWQVLDPYYQYVGYQDRLLVPTRFNYLFSPVDLESSVVENPSFKLFDTIEADVPKVSINIEGTISSQLLDFSGLSTGWYRLEVTAGSTYADQKWLYINGSLFDIDLWGVVEINNNSTIEAFRLMDEDKHLRSPIFEIRLLNRSTYWKYFLHQWDVENGSFSNSADYVFGNDQQFFECTQPRPLSRFAQSLEFQNAKIPAPYDQVIKPGARKIYSEIYLPRINS